MPNCSVGGIIAAGLVKKGWSAPKCTDVFKELCQTAFQPAFLEKHLGNVIKNDFLKALRGYFFPRFLTKGLDDALIKAFGPETKLFGGGYDLESAFQPKVALVKSTTGGAALLANYNRPEPSITLLNDTGSLSQD